MKIVILAAPTAVNTGHPTRGFAELRQPIEGPLTVSDEEAQRLKENGLLEGEPEDVPVDEEAEVPADLAGKKPAELKVIALKEGAPLNDATKASDMIAAIVAHRSKEA
jgi:hypothetical protein